MADLHHRCWLEGYVGLVPAGVLERLDVQDRLQAWTQKLDEGAHPTTVLVDEHDRAIALVRVEGSTIVAVYVDPDHWGSGLGHRLVQEGERLLREAGVRDADLWTLVGNERAVALYESEGWQRDGTDEWHDHPFGFQLHEQRLVKRLD